MRVAVPPPGRPAAPAEPVRPACATDTDLFLHPLLEELDDAPSDAAAHPESSALLRRARAACAACPQLPECMYAAVVQRDVAGFVG